MSIFKGAKDQIALKVTAQMMQDYGKVLKVPFVAVYKKLSPSEAKAVMERVQAEEIGDTEVVTEHLIEWRDMPGAEGADLDFSPEALAEALETDGYRRALVEGFMEVQFGRETVRRKN